MPAARRLEERGALTRVHLHTLRRQWRPRTKCAHVPSAASLQSKCPLNTGWQAWPVCVCLHASRHTST